MCSTTVSESSSWRVRSKSTWTLAYGLMLWDGESKGTLNSVINMLRQDKPVVVYLAPRKAFQNLRSADDLTALLSKCDRASVQRFERELGIESMPHRTVS